MTNTPPNKVIIKCHRLVNKDLLFHDTSSKYIAVASPNKNEKVYLNLKQFQKVTLPVLDISDKHICSTDICLHKVFGEAANHEERSHVHRCHDSSVCHL